VSRTREVPLTGGRVTPGVVRLDDTVRRPRKPGLVPVGDLLNLLATQSFAGAPKYLGVDDQARVTLSYLPGDVPTDLGHYEVPQLVAAAVLLRRFHDATAGSQLVPDGSEVICHNDFGPPNAVFADGLPYAMIDFDTAAPGTRLWDLGYSAMSWLDLGDDAYSGPEQVRRLQVFVEAYGHPECKAPQVAIHAVARQARLAAHGAQIGDNAMAEWSRAAAAWTSQNVLDALMPSGLPSDR
jgi:hypothetical protein